MHSSMYRCYPFFSDALDRVGPIFSKSQPDGSLVTNSRFSLIIGYHIQAYFFSRTHGHFTHKTKSPWPVSLLQALSLVEKEELVQVPFTLCLRDQRSMWMQDGCKCLYGSLRDIEWIIFHGHLDCSQKPPFGGRPNTKPLGDHGTPNAHNNWFI